MSVLANLGCLLNFHQPRRRDVVWDGRSYIGVCRNCGTPIVRQSRRKWRKREDEGEETSPPISTDS